MARVKFNPAIPDAGILAFIGEFSTETVFIDEFSKKHVTVTSADSGAEIVVTGKNFTRKQGDLTGGTVTDMIIKDGNGAILFTIENGTPSKLAKDTPLEGLGYAIIELMQGNDKISGSFESDIVFGFGGKDRIIAGQSDDILIFSEGLGTLTGGLGSDHFILLPNKGSKSIVTDFDAIGGGAEQDYVFLRDGAPYEAFERGNDLWIKIDGGGTVILKGVEFPDFGQEDFRDPPPDLF
ncbi:MAG: hypothetical protein KL863_27775 [Rhizobium sp.]|nr:hypothetical protein [Rhizobium sp.]